MRRHRVGLSLFALACFFAYIAVPVFVLALSPDGLILSPSASQLTHEQRQYVVASHDGRGVTIRRYAEADGGRCVIFFSGQHGGIATYERSLLPMLHMSGYSLYTLSYPGQDGAPGRASLSKLTGDVDRAVRLLEDGGLCNMAASVFVGRSFGASVAIVEASRLHPRGVLVEGVSPDLATAVRAWMRRHVVTWFWQWLPIEALLPATGDLKPILADWPGTPMIVFQGTEDDVTPFQPAKALMLNRPGVRFEAVTGAGHENTFHIAAPAYRAALFSLANP